MLTDKFRIALEEYHRKKWFPETYRDPFGEFIDYVSDGMISDLLEAWKQNRKGSLLDAGYYLFQILPQIRFREISHDYRNALSEPLMGEILPEFAFFHIRTLPEEQSSTLWNDFRNWNDKWETTLSEWIRTALEFENEHSDFLKAFHERLHLDTESEFTSIEQNLRGMSELFAWRVQTQSRAENYRELLRHFRFERWQNIAEWKNFHAIEKSVAETCGISNLPELQSSSNSAIQFLYPVSPPRRVVIEYGAGYGPVDALRFLQELGKAAFYAGMNPTLEIEERICGDPALSWFWANIFASLLTDSAGTKNFIGLQAEGLEQDMEFVMESWLRHESMLALCRRNAISDWKNFQDNYASLWEATFSLEPPRFLYLYDLSRSGESLYKVLAMRRAKETIQTLRTKYGSKWFASPKWIRRMRDYFWEGYRLTMQDVVRDL